LASNDFWLFPEIVYLKGTKISGYRIRQKIWPRHWVPQQEFQRLAKCIAAQEKYFEGDPSQ
jgi:hypothetical protein